MSYTNISTFHGGEYKRDVRELILNPLITQHNDVAMRTTEHDHRIERLELGGGSGGGGDLDPLLARLTTLEEGQVVQDGSIVLNSDAIVLHEESLVTLAGKVTALEEAPGGGGGGEVAKPITKYYVLPMGGQSNCVGYGESPYNIKGVDGPNPRIKQLGRYATGSVNDDLTIAKTGSNYDELWDKLRPHADCNLKVIPATPCLDFGQNMFKHSKLNGGGTVSSGMYIAKMLLPYIPDDYGILIVPCAYGGTGFISGSDGTWNQAKLRAENARRHGVDKPLSKDFYYRTKFALELNPENKLLPFVWIQGENDKGSHKAHYTGFKSFFDWFLTKFEADGLDSYLPQGRMDNFRWFCVGPTKWMLTANLETDYINLQKNWDERELQNRVSIYNNYSFLSSHYKTENGSSKLLFLRVDVDKHGKFAETNREWGTGETTSGREIHFSTKGFSSTMAESISNAIFRHTTLFPNFGTTHTRPVLGGAGLVETDNVTSTQNTGVNFTSTKDGLILYQNFSSGALNTNIMTSGGVTITPGSSVTHVTDPDFTKVALFAGGSVESYIKYGITSSDSSYTKSIMFKPDVSTRDNAVTWVFNYEGSSAAGGICTFSQNSIVVYPDYTAPNGRKCSLIAAAALEGNWNGDIDGWQHLTITYSKEAGICLLYLNGDLVQSRKTTGAPLLNSQLLGNAGAKFGTGCFKGRVSSCRIYNRSLGSDEIKAIYHIDSLPIL
jgi:hypothetical protein